jgi:hypothetical protein
VSGFVRYSQVRRRLFAGLLECQAPEHIGGQFMFEGTELRIVDARVGVGDPCGGATL